MSKSRPKIIRIDACRTNWTEPEDVALCQSWVAVSQNFNGTYGSLEVTNFWDSVTIHYNQHRDKETSTERLGQSCKCRWLTLCQSFSKWMHAWSKASKDRGNAASRESNPELWKLAHQYYSEIAKRSSFKSLAAFDVVKNTRVFQSYMETNSIRRRPSKQSPEAEAEVSIEQVARSSSPSCSAESNLASQAALPALPVLRPRSPQIPTIEVRSRRAGPRTTPSRPLSSSLGSMSNPSPVHSDLILSAISKSITRFTDIYQERTQILRKEQETKEMQSWVELFSKDVTGMDPTQQEFFHLQREWVLKKLQLRNN
jgi:hypothetical protein